MVIEREMNTRQTGYIASMTQEAQILGADPTPDDTVHPLVDRPVDLRAVATESPAESIAHENEIVEHIALEDEDPAHPDAAIVDQLRALIDPEEIRRHV